MLGTVGPLTVNYDYDLAGNIENIMYPDLTVITYVPDAFYRIGEVKLDTTTLASIEYNQNNMITSITYGNDFNADYSYYARDWIKLIQLKDSIGAVIDSYDFTYDGVGNIKTLNNEIYDYDDLDRLTYAQGPWGTISYTYDSVGNRLTEDVGDPSLDKTYVYDTYNKLTDIEFEDPSTPEVHFEYDNYGNIIRKIIGEWANPIEDWEYEYDTGPLVRENELATVYLDGELVRATQYDAFGRLIIYSEGTTTKRFIYSNIGVIHEISQPENIYTNYVYANGFLIAKIIDGETYYYHQDHLSSTRRVTNNRGATVFTADYKPFGEIYNQQGSETYKFTGERHEDNTGLYYLYRRYYDPELGRFISQDPVLGSLSNPQSMNRYVYVVNNPIKYTDPSGLGECPPRRQGYLSIAESGMSGGPWCGLQAEWKRWESLSPEQKGSSVAIVTAATIIVSCMFTACVGSLALAVGSLTLAETFFILDVALLSADIYAATTIAFGGTPTWEGAANIMVLTAYLAYLARPWLRGNTNPNSPTPKAPKNPSKNVPFSRESQSHILKTHTGDVLPGKDAFPSEWSNSRVLSAVQVVADTGVYKPNLPGYAGWQVFGVVGDVTLRVIVHPYRGIVTGHPWYIP